MKLDARDNDPVHLWTSIATAIDRIRPGLGRPAMRQLKMFGRSIDAAVDELANSLTGFAGDLALVLDDMHLVTHADCIASLNQAVVALPSNVRLIVISRSDPALRLPQLRASGELLELRARELMLTLDEARELLVEHEGIDLSPAEVELLHERTEGWPAALFLAALWLRRSGNPHETVRAFGGDHHFIADYLTTEVIASLDEETRTFLLQVCVLRQFTPELCDAVLDRSDSEAVLARLESANPFVARLERGSAHRVHSLFAEFAAYQLTARDPDAPADIHRRASMWFRARRMCAEAVEHAAAAGDRELVADILGDHYLQLIRSGQSHALRQWMQLLDDEQIVSHPVLAVGGATAALVLGGEGLERRHYLALVHRTEAEFPERMTPYVRSTAEMVSAAAVDRDVGRAVDAGRRAVAFARMDTASDATLVAALGACSRALYLAGEVDDAWAIAMEAIEHPDVERRQPGYAFACTALALAAVDRGWLPSARTHADRAKSIIDDLGLNRTWLGANTAAALGCVLVGEGDLAEAESRFAIAEHFFGGGVISVPHAWVLVRLASVRCKRGRLEQAQATLHLALDAFGTFTDAGRLPSLAEEVKREIAQERRRASRGEMLETPSQAEISVLRLLAGELSARAIGEELFISPNTVRSHTRALYRKLGVSSRADAIARAEMLGLLAHGTLADVNTC